MLRWAGPDPPPWSTKATRQKLNPRKQTAPSPSGEAPVRLWAEGEGPEGNARPLPCASRPLPSSRSAPAGGRPGGASGAVLASCRGLASPVYRWVFVLALRRFPAPGSTARGPTGPVRAEGGKKIANRASLRSGPRGAPALFSAPGGRSTFCTISAYRRFFVRSLLSLYVATLPLPAAPNEGDDGQNDKRTALVSFLITVRWLTFLFEQAIP